MVVFGGLVTLATQCQQYFQKSWDIEWAFKGETLYLLQCRPITRSFA
ncbi:PEP/pyruvate-binding domain-containing protein [uncultured Nostoc sp.]